MNRLEKTISDLASSYLLKASRDWGGEYSYRAQATALLSMLGAENIENLFDAEDSRNSSLSTEYSLKLKAILDNHSDHHFAWNSYTKRRLVENVLENYFRRVTSEMEASATARESARLRQRIMDLEAQIEFGKPAASVTFWDKLNTRINLPYLILLLLFVVLVGGLTLLGLSADMAVNVEFNIGEIIGGLLIGTGVAAAGVSYATRGRGAGNKGDEE